MGQGLIRAGKQRSDNMNEQDQQLTKGEPELSDKDLEQVAAGATTAKLFQQCCKGTHIPTGTIQV
jgi:hypothetical protein